MATINGTSGNDTLTSGNQADTLNGLGGNDVLYGGGGNDLLNGDAGNDSLYGGSGADRLFGGDGDDLLDGGSGNDILYGGNGNDILNGGDGNDSMFGDAGDDTLLGGAGADTMDGGSGIDTVDYSSTSTAVVVNLATGIGGGSSSSHSNGDRYSNIENVIGGSGADTITGNGEANHLSGGGGNDQIFGGDGDDTLDGGTGNDILEGGAGNDLLLGGAGNDNLSGGAGDDTLDGGAGNDTLSGGAGNDTATWESSGSAVNANLLTGTATGTASGTDALSGIENLTGSAYGDTLTGDGQANVIDGGGGSDNINAGSGNDTIYGGDGNDTIVAGNDSGAWSATGLSQASYNLIYFGTFADVDPNESNGLSENAANLLGTHGSLADPLSGRIVRTTAVDLNGDNILADNDNNSSTSEHFLIDGVPAYLDSTQAYFATVTFADGSTGSFTAVVIQMTDGRVYLAPEFASNADSILLTSGQIISITLNSIEEANSNLYALRLDTPYLGAPDNDLVYGGAGNDSISGGAGDDTLHGDEDNDTIDGGTGNDMLYGGTGDDLLYGGAGDDFLDAGDGDDVSHGGDGDDTIYFGAGNDTVYGGAGNDLIDDVAGAVLPGENLIYGDEGNDTVWSGGGNDTVYGGDGNDLLYGEDDNDRLYGDAGHDTLYGGTGDDTLYGGAGNDQLFGGDGRDVLHADGGNDTLTGGAGNDVFVVSSGSGAVLIADFGAGNTGAIDDNDNTNNDFVDLSAWYNETTLAAWNAANPGQTYNNPLQWMIADHADGVLDAVGGGLRIQNGGVAVSSDMLVFETTGVVCFARGTRIQTPRGEIAVEALRAGDLVTTLDAGPQVLRWIGSRRIGAAELAAEPGLGPVRIRAGSLGQGLPRRDLTVSPQHRILLRSRIVERMTGEPEVLLAAKHMTGLDGIGLAGDCRGVEYFHLLFDRHQILFAEGAPAESLLFGKEARKMLRPAAVEEILTVLPALAVAPPPPARALMDGRTGRSLVRRMRQNGVEALCAADARPVRVTA